MTLRAFRPNRQHGLQRRFIGVVLTGVLLFSTIAGGLAYRTAHRHAVEASLATLRSLSQAVEKTLAIGTYAGDQVLLREVAEGLARNDLVASIEVRAASGALLAGKAPDALAAAASGADRTLNVTLTSPFDSQEQIGVLRIVADPRRVDAIANREATWLASLMAGQAVLLAFLLYIMAARLVSRPIVRVSRQLHALQPGTHERLATPAAHRHDEIGLLIDGANALLDANVQALERERALLAEVQAMEAQYRQIFDSSSAGIFVLDQAGQLINGNPTVSRVVGLSVDELRTLRQDFIGRIFGQPDKVRAMVEEAARRGQTVSGDLELVQAGQARRWVHCLISVQAGTPPGESGAPGGEARMTMVEGVMYDITERKRAENAVRYQAEHDGLTGLKNRAASEQAIDRFLHDALAEAGLLAVLCIDLDGFKQINDSLGHQAGDEVLRICAERMRRAVRRASDLVGRMGGDEFIVALRGLDPAQPALAEAAAALLAAISAPIPLADGRTTVQVGGSVGIACLGLHGVDRLSLTQAADEAMYAVKETGKNAYAMALAAASTLRPEAHAAAAGLPQPAAPGPAAALPMPLG